MIESITLKITPGRFAYDNTMRELEIVVRTRAKEYMVRKVFPADWFESEFDRIMDSLKEQLRAHIKDDRTPSLRTERQRKEKA